MHGSKGVPTTIFPFYFFFAGFAHGLCVLCVQLHMRFLPFTFLLMMHLGAATAQDALTVRKTAADLSAQMRTGDDASRMQAAMKLEQTFIAWFSDPVRFATNLDSLPYLGQLRSDDGKLLLVCWNLVLEDESLRYHCLVFFKDKKKAEVRAVALEDNDTEWDKLTRKALSPSDWYGALYYRIITHRHKKRTYYTLLGWDGNDNLTNRKVVDVLNIEGTKVTIGGPMFVHEKRPAYRLVYEYANDATMALNWSEKEHMIVMDHLAPDDSRMKGQYQFYGPDFSYDGLRFQKGKWVLQEDLEAKNKGLNNLPE